jgi:hypothetical protein
MTFWAWLGQFFTNITFFVLTHLFYGKSKYGQAFFNILHLSLNFNVLPILYFMLAEDSIKGAISRKQYFAAFKIIFTFN